MGDPYLGIWIENLVGELPQTQPSEIFHLWISGASGPLFNLFLSNLEWNVD